jgi:protein gp37
MGDKTLIAWTDRTFNPWMGCENVSAGCKHCYAERMVRDRMGYKNLWGPGSTRQVTSAANWRKPVKWNLDALELGRPVRVFCGSLCDVFDAHPVAARTRFSLWSLIRETPALDWQLLTKRPENIRLCLPDDWFDGYPNVWLGVTIESNQFTHRADILRRIPAAVRFVSYEPALGPLDQLDLAGIDWMIYGGESGPGFRRHELKWARHMRDRCALRGIPYFFKQSPAYKPGLGTTLDGETIKQFPRSRAPRSSPSPDLELAPT